MYDDIRAVASLLELGEGAPIKFPNRQFKLETRDHVVLILLRSILLRSKETEKVLLYSYNFLF